MRITTATIAAAIALIGCGDPQHKANLDNLELQYIQAFRDAPGSKKCLTPKQLDGRTFTLCGINNGGPQLANAGLWELRPEGAFAANGKAMTLLGANPQLKPLETPPPYDIGKARSLFD